MRFPVVVFLLLGGCVGPGDDAAFRGFGTDTDGDIDAGSSSTTGCPDTTTTTTTTGTSTGEPPDPCPEPGEVWDPDTCRCVEGCAVDEVCEAEDNGPDDTPPAADRCDDAVIASGCGAFAESVTHADRSPGEAVVSNSAHVTASVQNTARTDEHDMDACFEDEGLKTQTATATGDASVPPATYNVTASGSSTMTATIQVNVPGNGDTTYTVAASIEGIYAYTCACQPGDDTDECDDGPDVMPTCTVNEVLEGETLIDPDGPAHTECITTATTFEFDFGGEQLVLSASADGTLVSNNNNENHELDAMHTAFISLDVHGRDQMGRTVTFDLDPESEAVTCGGRYHGQEGPEIDCEDPGPLGDVEPGLDNLLDWIEARREYIDCLEEQEEFGLGDNSAAIRQEYVCETICEDEEHNERCRPEYETELCRFGDHE